ncbi:response regulator [Chryseolinea lacunae]|uniref:Response regulator n=1 Tax=Chryseolinea lacunae TaxID=2801331 RepID=A0ABS1L313_9BACT|nr:response regulator [Chryseolinea lacunae]MBL0745828.1 response regulator [Chryseolinea lacunae]
MMHKILLIDDTPDVLENLKELLLMEGYAVVTALNGDEALRALLDYRPDLIITDLRMPRMDGFALLQAVKADPALKAIPVLVFSANATPENEDKSLQLGAAGFLKKPCNTDVMLASIQTLLQTL